MNSQTKIRDLFEPKIRFSIMEDASGSVDGVHILARVKGEFFFPDGTSRNKRFYPAQAWENVIDDPETQRRLEKRLMFGTIGHDQELNDKAVREGAVSHFMDKIYIENGKGIGEALIMNTPVGQILNTMLRSGSQLSVSSRADGRFKGSHDGMPSIDPNNFFVIGWDFVIDPGFLDANPQIAEAYKKTLAEEKKGGGKMGTDAEAKAMQNLVDHITEENGDLKTKNSELATEIVQLRESNTVLADESKHLKEQLASNADLAKKLEAYAALGTAEEIAEALEVAGKSASVLESYQALGSVKEITQTFKTTEEFMTSFQEKFGSQREIAQVFRVANQTNERLLKIGSLEEIEKMAESFEKLVNEAEEVQAETEKQAQQKEAEDIAAEVGAPVDDVLELLQTKTGPEVKALYAKVEENLKKKLGIVESAPAKPSPYKKTGAQVNESATPTEDTELKESSILSKRHEVKESRILGKTRIDRINETFGK